jgi:hypothetical protein
MSVTVVRSAGHDRMGDPIGVDTEHELVDAVVAPRTSSDTAERARNGVVVGLVVYAPPGSDVLRSDRIRYDGELYDIDGDVGVWASPFGPAADGVELALRRGEG